MRKRLWIWVLGLSLAVAVHLPVAVTLRAQEPIVQPGDVATPTPTAVFPTPTPSSVLLSQGALPPSGTETGVRTYIVQPGDTILSVALETGLDIEDVPCAIAPDFAPDRPLVIGNLMSIPPANVACYTVEGGDTLATVAAQHGSTAEEIYRLPWNELTGRSLAAVRLAPGSHLRVPLPLPASWSALLSDDGGSLPEAFLPMMLRMPVNTSPFAVFAGGPEGGGRGGVSMGPVPADWPYGSGHFAWPVYGWLSQSYRYDHRAIDIAAQQGTPVTAADRGVVIRAGWNDQGYGRFVVIDHNIDYITLYAHLDRIFVEVDDVVAQGQVLGTVGSTGNSTGPHLHLELRDFGRLTNPLELLALE